MRQILPVFLLLALNCLLTNQLIAQAQFNKQIADSERFSAGVIFGFNSAQIDGDYQTGFDKYGITGGIRGIARITSRLDLNIEMIYSKKGSRIFENNWLIEVRPKKSRIIDLTYVEAPIYFKWLLKDQASTWHIELGGMYSRLTNTKITEDVKDVKREFSYENITIDFDKGDISVLAGFGHSWANGFALNLRYAFGLSKFYQNENFVEPIFGSTVAKEVQFLRNYYYSLTISYTIFKRELKDARKKRRK